MWSRRNTLAAIAGALAAGTLGGCGFRPLYGRSGGADLSDILSQVEIGPVRNYTTNSNDIARVGQQLHNALLEGLSPRGPSGEQIYRLDVILNESISSLAVQKSADATRADLSLSSSFILQDLRTGARLYSGNSQAVSSFNILNSEFATLMAEKGARDRAVQQLGDDIRLKVAIYLKSNPDKR
ncbi:MAG: LPS assembly lipoprotein LptE [Rhodospirillales bacterium]